MSQGSPYVSELTLADSPNAVPWARRHAVDILRRWQVPSDTIETARLIVSELATNAIRHPGRSGPHVPSHPELADIGTFSLMLQLTGAGLVVQVSDRDPRPPVRKEVGPEATGGRGLFLVHTMANRWGYYPTPSGKVVWAELLPQVPSQGRSAAADITPPAGRRNTPDTANRFLDPL